MGKFTHDDLARQQKQPVQPVVKVDLTGKVVIITGANTGLGFEAAKHFASMNPQKLIVACRSKEKGEKALAGAFAKRYLSY